MASKNISYNYTKIFPFNEGMAKSITDSIIARGYVKTKVIHLFKIREEPETMKKPIREDGAHRVAAEKIAEIDELPVYKLQILRRNLEPYQILDAMEQLNKLRNPGKKASTKLSPFKFRPGEIKYGK